MDFVSVLGKDIRNIFGSPPTKISKTVNDGTSSEDSILPSSDSLTLALALMLIVV